MKNKTNFENFLKEIPVINKRKSIPTINSYIRLYKLCKNYKKFLYTTKSLRFYNIHHSKIKHTLKESEKEKNFWKSSSDYNL